MGYAERCPQFDRGDTFSDQGLVTMTAAGCPELVGKIFEFPDTEHGSAIPVKIRMVRLKAAVTGDLLAMEFDTGTTDYGTEVVGYADTAGVVAKPLDEKHNGQTLTQYDIVGVVEEGYTTVTLGATVSAGAALATDTAGKFRTATEGQTVIAIAREGGDANDDIVAYVLPGLTPSDPAAAG